MKKNQKRIDELDKAKLKRGLAGGALATLGAFGVANSGNKYVSHPSDNKDKTEISVDDYEDDDEVNTQQDINNYINFHDAHVDEKKKYTKKSISENHLRKIVENKVRKSLAKLLSEANKPNA